MANSGCHGWLNRKGLRQTGSAGGSGGGGVCQVCVAIILITMQLHDLSLRLAYLWGFCGETNAGWHDLFPLTHSGAAGEKTLVSEHNLWYWLMGHGSSQLYVVGAGNRNLSLQHFHIALDGNISKTLGGMLWVIYDNWVKQSSLRCPFSVFDFVCPFIDFCLRSCYYASLWL